MKLHDLSPAKGSHRPALRVGRGHASGAGKTANRGQKGQHARGTTRLGFEGGQMPLQRIIRKRGFNNIFATVYTCVNVGELNCFEDGAVVDFEALKARGLAKKLSDGIKILGNGELSKKITVNAKAFSKSAKEKIEKAGGKAEVI